MMPIRLTALVTAASLILATAAVAQTEPTTIFVVRHAEKGPETPDPDLTPAGTTRASALAHMLGDVRVSAVFASEFKRTQQTAAAVATKLGLTTQVVPAGKMDELIGRLETLPTGSRALVVSHSNLVPAIVERLSGQKVAELTDADYDRIYVVTRIPGGGASVLYLHYGAPNAGTAGAMRP